MKRRALPLLGVSIFLHIIALPADIDQPEAVEFIYPNRLMWSISGKGIDSPSYLFGTIHQVCPEDFVIFAQFCTDEFKLYNPLEKKLLETKQLVLEVNTYNPYFWRGMQSVIYLEEGMTLHNVLTRDQYKLVEGFFMDSLGINIEHYIHVRPFFLVSEIYPHILGCKPRSYESYLADIAMENRVGITGIESIDDQIALFEKIKLEDEVYELIATIEKYYEVREQFREMVAFYRKRDLKSVRSRPEEEPEEQIYEDAGFITERNLEWLPLMIEMIHEKPVFFAFGAAHLPGEEGLVNLLRGEGYRVEPVF